MSMFNGKLKSELPVDNYINTNSMSNGVSPSSVIGAGTVVKGDISCNSDIRIDGTLTGNITSSAKVIIGSSGVIDGDITGQQADIMGRTSGTIKIKDLLQLKGSCVVNGNIYAGKLQVEPSATFNGECHMGGMREVVEYAPVENDQYLAE